MDTLLHAAIVFVVVVGGGGAPALRGGCGSVSLKTKILLKTMDAISFGGTATSYIVCARVMNALQLKQKNTKKVEFARPASGMLNIMT